MTAQTGEEEERHRDEIDADREQGVLTPSIRERASGGGVARRDRPGSGVRSTSSAISSTKKLATSAVTAGIRKIDPTMMPSAAAMERTQVRIDQRRVRARAEQALEPIRARGRKPGEQPVQPDAHEHDQHEREADGFQQDRAERRRDELRECLDGGVEHRCSPVLPRPSHAGLAAGAQAAIGRSDFRTTGVGEASLEVTEQVLPRAPYAFRDRPRPTSK